MNKAFTPAGPSVSIAATAASASAAIDQYSNVVRVVNLGPNKAFIRFTIGASAATVTDMPIAANNVGECFTVGVATVVSAICAGAETASLYFTNGEGGM